MGKNLIYVPECHSTNSLALELSQQASTGDGTVIITNHQTSGRGQRGNTWEAEQGKNLTFSIILKPLFLSIKDQFYLNIFTSLAIHDFLCTKTNEAINIKWPNDILIDGKKLCGILIENQIRGSQVSNTIVGIGLNVNQKDFQVSTATSLAIVLDKSLALEEVLEELLSFIEVKFLQLRQGDLSKLKQHYLQHLYWIGEKHVFSSSGILFDGIISGINDMGKLTIETLDGVRAFDVKEISYVR